MWQVLNNTYLKLPKLKFYQVTVEIQPQSEAPQAGHHRCRIQVDGSQFKRGRCDSADVSSKGLRRFKAELRKIGDN